MGDADRRTPDRTDYTDLFVGGSACGIYGTGQVGCWATLADAPASGNYVQIASAYDVVCALHMGGRVDCSGPAADEWARSDNAVPYPGGKFEEISVGADWACGITTDLTVKCWGDGSGAVDLSEDVKAISLKENTQ